MDKPMISIPSPNLSPNKKVSVDCEKLKIKFIGMQENAATSYPLFNCLITGSTFMVSNNETIEQATQRIRQQWGVDVS